jgi:spermidine synthase
LRFLQAGALLLSCGVARAAVVFETTSAYHHIQVIDDGDLRTLCFDRTSESRMQLSNPLAGQFEYTEMFHLAWLWYGKITNVLMIGLGGASTQRAFEHDYPGVQIDTAEIDPAVLRVATAYFHFQESPRQHVFLEDGRVYLRRTAKQFDAIFVDAYAENRYGAFIPQHLLTREFFALAASRLTTNGVLAYNVMGSLNGWQAGLLGATYKTLKSVFPQVYLFPCTSSRNVVFIATKATEPIEFRLLYTRADFLLREGRVRLPSFRLRLNAFYRGAPPATATAPLLTDDFAPVEGLLQGVNRQD